MAVTNFGVNHICSGIIGASITAFSNANAAIGVGDSSTVFAATQNDLQASSNKLRVAMDVTFPTQATNVLTFQSTFTTGQANFAWQEWGVFNGTANGIMLSRKVESLGTKTSAQSWQINAALTFTAA
jgi:hypothetical protein